MIESVLKRLARLMVLCVVVVLTRLRTLFSRRWRLASSVLRGRPPPPPKVLGVIVPDKRSLRSEPELQGLARIVTWARGSGFKLLSFYSPYGLFSHRVMEKALDWAGIQDDVTVWKGWDAPREWVESGSRPLGVALLGPEDAERPLAMLGETPGSASASGSGSAWVDTVPATSLERALEAPSELKRMMERVVGPTSSMFPDIILIFGSSSSLFGYPNWMTRSVEIYQLGDLAAVTSAKLSASLERYLRTHVRLGR